MEWIVPKGGVEMKKSVVSLFLLVLIVIMNFVGCTESENFGDVKNRMTYYTSNDSDDFCDLIKYTIIIAYKIMINHIRLLFKNLLRKMK